MSDLAYSSDAINVLNRFFRVDVIVYVEGEDDVVFWDEVFRKCGSISAELIPLGDCCQVDIYAEKILNGELNAIAARDKDYLHFLGREIVHPRVIYTVGHSIENSLLSHSSITDIAKICCRDSRVSPSECKGWIGKFVESFRSLCSLELAKEIDCVGEVVLGDNCTRFMITDNSDIPCVQKISAHVTKVSEKLSVEAIERSSTLMPSDREGTWRSLRGHFVMSGVQKFIANRMKERGRKASISYDQLFANAILHFRSSFVSGHPEFAYYDAAVRGAERTFRTVVPVGVE